MAGMSLGDIHLRFAWQAWHLWHWAGSGVALVHAWACLGTLGRRWRHGTLCGFASCGRRGTWWHPPSFCVAGVPLICTYGTGLALVARLGALGHAWARLVAGDAAVLCVAGVAHPPSLRLAGVPLMALGWLWWRAWVRWVPRGAAPLSMGRRGAWWHLPSFCVAGVALVALGWQCGVSSHTIFDFDTPSFTHNFVTHHLWHTTLSHTLFHTPSFTHHFVTHNLSHTPSLTRHLWHTIFHITLSHTIFHTPSQTIFHTHHLSHTTLSHTIFHHTIFHTQLCHTPSFATPSFTHHFVTHHLSHTTLSHTSFFFVTHHLSHTTLSHTQNFFFYVSILHHLLCLSFLPRPATTFVAHYWKKLACGVIRSFNLCVCVCFFLSLFVVVLMAPCWAHVEPCWAILGYFRVFVDSVGLYLGLGYFGVVAFWSCWAFILDLGISVLLGFGLVSLYFGLGHFSVVELWSCWPLFWTWAFQCRWVLVYSSRFPKKCKYQAKRNFWVALLLFLMLFVVPCFPFFFGHVALGLCWLCLKLMLRKIEPCWVVAASFSAHVGPMWSHLGLCWDRVGSCC